MTKETMVELSKKLEVLMKEYSLEGGLFAANDKDSFVGMLLVDATKDSPPDFEALKSFLNCGRMWQSCREKMWRIADQFEARSKERKP